MSGILQHNSIEVKQEFKRVYKIYQQQIEQFLQHLIDSNTEPASLYDPFSYVLKAGGKRIRPVLTMLANAAVGGNPQQVLSAGAAIEILHNFTLVHDDIMDKAPLRRGNQTVHVKWNESTAILTGDVMMGFAYRMLIQNCPTECLPSVLEAYTQGFIDVCEGQAYDLDFHHTMVTMPEYLDMIEKKTSRLLEMSVAVGGIIGGGTEAQIAALVEFARCIGIAFQIQDDLLDLTANQHEFGKTTGQDIVEGKKTYLIVRCNELATEPHHLALLHEFVTNKGLESHRVPEMYQLMEELGVFEETQQMVDVYFVQAHSALQALPHSIHRDYLEEVIDILNQRKS